MPISFAIDTKLGVILIEAKGIICDDDLELALRGIRADQHFSPTLRLFADLTGIQQSRLSAAGMNRFARLMPPMETTKRAILVKGQAEFGMFRSYQAYCTLHNKPAPQVFTDRVTAIEFLNQKMPQQQHLPLTITPLKAKPSCAWCKGELRFEDLDNTHFHVSGGLCVSCLVKFSSTPTSQVSRFLETKEQPVLLVDGDIRVLSANSSFGTLIGKPSGSIENKSSGSVFGCEMADCCASSEACLRCSLRRTINDCLAGKATQGETQLHRSTQAGSELVTLRYSTERVRNLVLLRIDSLTTSPLAPNA